MSCPTSPTQVWDSLSGLLEITPVSTVNSWHILRHNTNEFLPPSLNASLWAISKSIDRLTHISWLIYHLSHHFFITIIFGSCQLWHVNLKQTTFEGNPLPSILLSWHIKFANYALFRFSVFTSDTLALLQKTHFFGYNCFLTRVLLHTELWRVQRNWRIISTKQMSNVSPSCRHWGAPKRGRREHLEIGTFYQVCFCDLGPSAADSFSYFRYKFAYKILEMSKFCPLWRTFYYWKNWICVVGSSAYALCASNVACNIIIIIQFHWHFFRKCSSLSNLYNQSQR